MPLISWRKLQKDCPVKLDRLKKIYKDFQNNCDIRVETPEDIQDAKENLSKAKTLLERMLKTITIELYDESIIKTKQDNVILASIIDDIGRKLKDISEKEYQTLQVVDGSLDELSPSNVAKLLKFANELRSVADSLVLESLHKAVEEYNKFDEEKDRIIAQRVGREAIPKDKNAFLYIFYKIFSINSQISGGLARVGSNDRKNKKDISFQYPTAWKALKTNEGQEKIKESYESKSGSDMEKSFPEPPANDSIFEDEEDEEND